MPCCGGGAMPAIPANGSAGSAACGAPGAAKAPGGGGIIAPGGGAIIAAEPACCSGPGAAKAASGGIIADGGGIIIAGGGWLAARDLREARKETSDDGKVKWLEEGDLTVNKVRLVADVIPPALITARFFADLKAALRLAAAGVSWWASWRRPARCTRPRSQRAPPCAPPSSARRRQHGKKKSPIFPLFFPLFPPGGPLFFLLYCCDISPY